MNRYRWVERKSANGNIYSICEDLMAIPNFYFSLVVYIYPTPKMAEDNESLGGSGFLIGVAADNNDGWYLYAVTNRHVIEGIKNKSSKECGVRFNTKDNKTDVVPIPVERWIYHPDGDDLAVCLLKPSTNWNYGFITEDWLLRDEFIRGDIFSDWNSPPTVIIDMEKNGDEEKWKEVHQMGIGDETITVGRFIKHAGTTLNYPVVRKGHIAMLPFEPIQQAGRDFKQDSFLVETYSIGGFSGSPVFVQTACNVRNKTPTSNGTAFQQKMFLLGIDWGHFDFEGDLIDPQTGEVKTPSGMMCVVPAWKLQELLHTTELVMQRKELDKEVKKRREVGASMDSASGEITQQEFENVLSNVTRKTKPNKSKDMHKL